jgi:uncharacterized protein (TIGR02145 family)
VTDNNNATYTATITSTTAETVTVTAAISATNGTNTANVSFTVTAATVGNSPLTASPPSVAADGTNSTMTLQAKDANGNNLSAGGLIGTMSQSGSATLSPVVTDVGDGTYTATITSTTAETVTVTAAIGGTNVTNTADVSFTVTDATVANSTLTASPTSVAADGTASSTMTMQAKDANDNNLITGGLIVTMSESGSATLFGVTDNTDGTYTATISSTTDETVTVTATFGGANVTNTADVSFTLVPMIAGGQTYSTVRIGDQIWTAENMRHDAVAVNTYTYPDDSAADVVTYGKLYDWAAAMEGSTVSAQGICAAGWHVPSDSDWQVLEGHLGMSDALQGAINWRGADEGTQLKEGGSSGFEAKLAGYRNGPGSFNSRGSHTYLWSSTPADDSKAYSRRLTVAYPTVGRNALSKLNGFSVRCVKN